MAMANQVPLAWEGTGLSVRQVKSEVPGGSRGEIGAGSPSTAGAQ